MGPYFILGILATLSVGLVCAVVLPAPWNLLTAAPVAVLLGRKSGVLDARKGR